MALRMEKQRNITVKSLPFTAFQTKLLSLFILKANGGPTPEHDADGGEDGAALPGSSSRPLPSPVDLAPASDCCQ